MKNSQPAIFFHEISPLIFVNHNIIKVAYLLGHHILKITQTATMAQQPFKKLRARHACVTTTATSDARPPKEDSIL